MLLRPARADDFDPIAALTNHFIANTSIHFGYEPVTPAELRDAWERSLARYPFIVAEVEGKFAGWAKAGVWRDRAAYQWTAESTVYVVPRSHRRGIGRALYTEVIERCRCCGFHSLIGGITLPDEPSIRLHEAMGFKKISHVMHAGWKFDAWHDVGFWQLMLHEGPHVAAPLATPLTD
jgi:phosphinothricin acetyltransferase